MNFTKSTPFNRCLLALNLLLLALILALAPNLALRNSLAAQDAITFKRTVVAKIADYTVAVGDSGKLFTTVGATGTVTFTLPAASATFTGYDLYIVCGAAQTLTVATATADTLVTLNDAAADSVSLSTASEKIGGGFHVFCDGTLWFALPLTEETQTITVAT